MAPTHLARTRYLVLALALAAGLVFPASWLLYRAESQDFAARQRAGVSQGLGDARAAIESALAARLTFPRALAAFAASRPDVSREAFAAFVRDLIRGTPAIRSAQLARDNVVSHVYPESDSPGILGLRLPGDLPPDQAEAVKEVLATGRPGLTGPVRLLQGGLGLIARVPVFLSDQAPEGGPGRLWGLVTVIVDTENFFREVGLPESRGIRLAIRKDGRPGDMVAGEAAVFADAPVVVTIALPGGAWELAAIPAGGWNGAPDRLSLAGFVLAIWLVLGLAIWMFLSWPARLKLAVGAATADLATARSGLEREVADRTRELRAANESLRKSEAALRDLRDNAPIGIFTSTPDGRYLVVNACLARLYGYASPRDMLGSVVNIRDQHYVDPGERDAMMEKLDAAGVLVNHEARRLTRTGGIIWVSLNMRALRDPAGTVIRYEGFCTEITERKRAEAGLVRQERQLRVVFDNSPLGLIYFDAQGAVVKCNQPVLERLRITAAQVEGQNLMPLFPGFVREALRRALDGEPAQAEGRLASGPGGTGIPYVRVAFNPVEPGRRPSEVIATVEDITRQREKDAELRLLWAATEASPASIVITDATGDIEYVNPHFTELTGYGAAEAKGKNSRLLKSGAQPEAFYREMWETINAGRIWRGQFCNRKKCGEIYWEDASISPIRDESGETTHFVAVKEDITERKKLEKIREDVERIMRHDLKAPLNSIINLPRIVSELGQVNEDQSELLAEIERVGDLMLGQINLSLDLYKMETGTFVPALQRVDLVHLTDTVVDMLAGPARVRGVTVRVEPAATQVFARADALLCQTIFGNLLKNAIEASKSGQEVTVRLTDGDQAQWAVHNPAEVPSDIRLIFFEKYATSGKPDGSGLGTYSARLMTECQGGGIRLDSSAAAGTTVTVTLAGASAKGRKGKDASSGQGARDA
jgi:PAS domain S-box-containing protein